MSLTLVKPYFIARCEAVGLSEHVEAFNADNIPSNLIDGSFHVALGTFSGIQLNQNDQEIECEAEISFWLKGYRLESEALDAAVAKAEQLILECLKNSNRLGVCIKNVVLNSVSFEPMGAANDNIVRCRIGMTALTSLAIS